MPSHPSAFDDFYAEHYAPLAVQLYAYAGDLPTAEAVAHEACCRALARWSRLEDPGAWTRRTAWGLVRSGPRRALARRAHAVAGTPRVPSPAQSAYLQALASMRPRPRRVFVLYHLAALPLADIADQEGIRLTRVRKALARAQARFGQHSAALTAAAATPLAITAAPDPAALPPPVDPYADVDPLPVLDSAPATTQRPAATKPAGNKAAGTATVPGAGRISAPSTGLARGTATARGKATPPGTAGAPGTQQNPAAQQPAASRDPDATDTGYRGGIADA